MNNYDESDISLSENIVEEELEALDIDEDPDIIDKMTYKEANELIGLKKYDEAREKLISLFDTNYIFRSLLRLIELEEKQGNFEYAKKICYKIIEIDDDLPSLHALIELAKIEFAQNDKASALMHYNEALKNGYMKRNISVEYNLVNDSLDVLDEEFKQMTPRTQKMNMRNVNKVAKMSMCFETYDVAKQVYTVCKKYTPEFPGNYLELSKIARYEGNYDETFENLEMYASICGKDKFYYSEMAKTYEALNDFDKAIANHLEISKIDTNDYRSLYEVARIYNDNYKCDDAKKYVLKSLGICPSDERSEFLRGQIESNLRNYEEAKKIFLKLLSSKHINKKYLYLELGKVEGALFNCEKAIYYFEEVLKIDENDKYALLEMAVIETKVQDYENALIHYKKLYEVDTENREQTIICIGRTYIRLGRFDEAREEFNKPELVDPILHEQAELCNIYMDYCEGKVDESIKALENIIKRGSVNLGSALNDIGRMYIDMKNFNKAREYLNMVSENDPMYYNAQQYLMYMDLKENKYNEASEKLGKLDSSLFFYYPMVSFYIRANTGLIRMYELENERYYQQQVLNYDQELAIKHISEHLGESDRARIHTIFDEDLDVRELFVNVQNKISDMEYSSFAISDKYIVENDYEVATINGERTKYIGVLTVLNTKNI